MVWDRKEKICLGVAIAGFFILLRPMFDISHPMGSEDLTLRLIASVLLSATLSCGGSFMLYIFLKA